MDFEQTEREFYMFGRGVPRLNSIRTAIALADEEQNLYWRFRFRFDYIEESIFSGDRYFAMIMFPELLSLYEKTPELQLNSNFSRDLLVCFRWIVEAAPEFPQISKSEIDDYFRLFKKMLIQQGKSLSIYYMKRSLFYMHVDKAIAAVDFYRFLDAPLDDVSDSKPLYYDQQAMYYLSIGEEEKALEAAKLIFAGKLRSNALPQATYHLFIRYYLEHEQYAHAMHYAFLAEHRVLCDPYYLDIISTLMSLYSVTKPPQGVKIFAMHYELYQDSKNPHMRLLFAIGAYHLFHALNAEKHRSILEELRIARDEPLFAQPPEQIAAHYYQEADTAAKKFDARNGTSDFQNMLNLFDKDKSLSTSE